MVELSASRFKGKPEPSSDPKMLGQDPPDFVPEVKLYVKIGGNNYGIRSIRND